MKTDDFITTLGREGARSRFPSPAKVAWAWLIVITFYLGVVIAIYGFREDITAKLVEPIYVIEMAGITLTAIMATWAASWLALPDVNQHPRVRFLALIPLAGLIATLVFNLFSSGSLTLMQCLQMGSYACMKQIFIFSLLPAAMLFYTIHRAAPIRCCWAGTMAALSVASFCYIILRLIDQHDEPLIVLFWHFIPVLVMMALGMIIGKLYLEGLFTHQ